MNSMDNSPHPEPTTRTRKAKAAHQGNGASDPTTPPGTIDEAALDDTAPAAAPTPFPDLEAALGLDDEGVEVVELLVDVARRKPRPTEFFRVSPDPAMSRSAYVLVDREEIGAEVYFVLPSARPYIAEHLRPVLLVTCVNRQGVTFLWPINIPDPNANGGRQNRWGTSALEAMQTAKTAWTKLVAGQGAYRVFKAENADLPPPQWPDKSFIELLGIAFKDALITDENHPMVRRLRGQT